MLKGFWIRNFKSLRQVGIGSCFSKFVFVNVEKDHNEQDILPHDLGSVTLFIGADGTGKSTAIDAFNFISDTYRYGVDVACLKRGGFDAIYSQGSKGPLSFGFQYRQKGEVDTVTYAVSVYRTKHRVPFIESEVLAYQRGADSLPIIFLQNGAEKSIRYLAPDERLHNSELLKIELTDHNHLGLAALELHPKYPVLSSLRSLFENWTLCQFTPDPARGLDKSLHRRQESPRGVSLSGVVRYIIKRYKNNLKPLLIRVADVLPNVESILIDDTDPEKPMISFQLKNRDKPIPITHLSEATIRLFTYTLLLKEEEPAPLVVLEEPENGLDRLHRRKILETLDRFEGTTHPETAQVFVTTHHSDVINGIHPSQVWVFEKDRDGFTTVERASDSIRFLSEEEQNDPQWYSVQFNE